MFCAHHIQSLKRIMKTKSKFKKNPQTTVASRVASEDIQQGDYITVLNDIVEYPAFMCGSSIGTTQADEIVRFRFTSHYEGLPFKVVAVCLPFVYTEQPKGKIVTFDIRQKQLVRLDRNIARSIWAHLRKPKKK